MAGGAWSRAQSANTRGKCAPENSPGHTGRSAIPLARACPSRDLWKTRRPLRRRPNKHSEKIIGARTRNLESTGETARQLGLTCYLDKPARTGLPNRNENFAWHRPCRFSLQRKSEAALSFTRPRSEGFRDVQRRPGGLSGFHP